MTDLLTVVLHLALALWVGGAFAFAGLFAPVAFRHLPSRELAGGVTGNALARLEALGLVVGGISLLGSALLATDDGWSGLALLRVVLAATMLALIVAQATTIRGRLAAVREQMGPRSLDELPADHPQRLEHRRLHRASVLLFSAAMLLGAVQIALLALRTGGPTP